MRQAYLRTHPKCFYLKNPRFWESRDQPTPGSFPKKDPGYEVPKAARKVTASMVTKPYSKFNFRHKFSLLVVGPTQSGKTYFVQQILEHNRIVYVSPSKRQRYLVAAKHVS